MMNLRWQTPLLIHGLGKQGPYSTGTGAVQDQDKIKKIKKNINETEENGKSAIIDSWEFAKQM